MAKIQEEKRQGIKTVEMFDGTDRLPLPLYALQSMEPVHPVRMVPARRSFVQSLLGSLPFRSVRIPVAVSATDRVLTEKGRVEVGLWTGEAWLTCMS